MPHYHRQGQIPPKRHTQFRGPDGKLRYEELLSTRGFEGPYSLLYHEHFPVEVSESEPAGRISFEEWPIDTQINRSMDTSVIESSGDILSSRRMLAYNDDLWVSVATPDQAMDGFYRNGLCDEFMMVIHGSGVIHSPFGALPYEEGDMILMPRGITYDFRADGDDTRLLIMESRTPVVPPKKYLVGGSQWAEHAPFCERDFKTPVLQEPILEKGRYKITAKVGDMMTRYIVPNHPFDVIGWDGTHYPCAVNIRNFEPVTRRIHTMPDEQQAFETAGAAICCFVPRMADYHPDAIPVPPVHSNIDCDELLLNLSGALVGWKGSKGLLTLHPRGLYHAAKIYEESIGMTELNGTALAIDTFKPVKLTALARACADPEYYKVWLRTTS
ncbi:MAG: homogentisate 1,2-dioxygenase [Sphingobium sp.]